MLDYVRNGLPAEGGFSVRQLCTFIVWNILTDKLTISSLALSVCSMSLSENHSTMDLNE